MSLRSLMTVNLLKRLESSVAAFRLTLRRLQQIPSQHSGPDRELPPHRPGRHASPILSTAFEDAEPDEDVEFLDPTNRL